MQGAIAPKMFQGLPQCLGYLLVVPCKRVVFIPLVATFLSVMKILFEKDILSIVIRTGIFFFARILKIVT